MSYQVLARKWRPHDFSSLLGQDHVVRALTHALTENRLHHAYLFTGTRGVGKTTISRILAKCLNCVGPDGKGGITAEPCGVCEACRAIDEDRFVDYIEMDAASTRGIDDMVSLLERAKYVPTNARFKVYMIDEVHQLTSAAFNAMLKTLEEQIYFGHNGSSKGAGYGSFSLFAVQSEEFVSSAYFLPYGRASRERTNFF